MIVNPLTASHFGNKNKCKISSNLILEVKPVYLLKVHLWNTRNVVISLIC